MKRAVITGAGSMIGIATAEACLRQGAEVVALVHRRETAAARLPRSERLKIVELPLAAYASYEPEETADVFYHFAWQATSRENGVDGRANPVVQQENIGCTLAAVELAHRYGCKKFVGAGSQAEYGLADAPLTADTPIRPFLPYGIAKYAAGKLAEITAKRLGMAFVWGRVLSVYGEHDRPQTLVSYVIDCYRRGVQPLLTKCEQIWDYLYEADAGRAFYLLGEKTLDASYYCIGSGEGRALRTYIETIHDVMQPAVPLAFGQKPYGDHQVRYLVADPSPLARATGFRPEVPFEDGIRRILAAQDVARP